MKKRDVQEWAVCAPYIGSVCPECGRVFNTPDDIKDCTFGLVRADYVNGANAPDVVCKGCWNKYTYNLVTQFQGLIEMIWGKYASVLSPEDIQRLKPAIRFATNEG